MATLHPYLMFDDKCEEAFHFYQSVFGGEFASFVRFNEIPGDNTTASEDANKIMHVSLPINDQVTLMGSDCPASMPRTIYGTSVAISIGVDSEAEAKKLFDGLSAGGTIKMPLEKTFWGAYFGMFTDKYGFHWQVSYDYKQ